MSRVMLLDAGPLGIVTKRRGVPAAEAWRAWVARCLRQVVRASKIVTLAEAQTQLPALLAAVEATGEPVLICHQGKPGADLVPHPDA